MPRASEWGGALAVLPACQACGRGGEVGGIPSCSSRGCSLGVGSTCRRVQLALMPGWLVYFVLWALCGRCGRTTSPSGPSAMALPRAVGRLRGLVFFGFLVMLDVDLEGAPFCWLFGFGRRLDLLVLGRGPWLGVGLG